LGWILAVLFALPLLVLLLLLPSLRLHFSSAGGNIKVKAKYLFLSFQLYPIKVKPEKKKKKKAKKQPEPEKDKPPPAEKEKLSALQTWEQYKPLIQKAKKTMRFICKRLIIYKVKARVAVRGPDAHQTAITYAKTASFTSILMQILGWIFTLKKTDIVIAPDFLGEKSSYDISFRLRIRPIFVLTALIGLLPALLKAFKKNKKTKRKGGKKYEPAASHK